MNAEALSATLYCVATPIGNLRDMTQRAVAVLGAVDVIACEDTRVTSKLLTAFGLKTPLINYHDHNGEKARPKILARLEDGEAVALVSDAGTPLISDPGYKLVAACREAGFSVVPVPGACAFVAALSVAGLPTDKFSFHGFLPAKASAREAILEQLKVRSETLIFYESTKRLASFLEAAFKVFGNRKAVVARELTKQYEEVVRNDLSALVEEFSARHSIKGECVVLIEGCAVGWQTALLSKGIELTPQQFYEAALRSLRVKDAAVLATSLFGGARKDHYSALQTLKTSEE